ncbi:SDR family NAD(P)-dependent oxidoreductase [Angustibacter aerolatus]
MDLGLQGRTALVSGGASGIGRETARQLLAEGVQVVVTDRDADGVRAAADELGATAVVADLTDPADVDRLAAEVREVLGGAPDVLVNAAGITGATGAFHEIDDAGWLETLQADLLSSVRLTRAFVEEMAHRGSGRIVNVASEDALNAYTDDPPYVASKAALLALTKVLSKTYGHRGVLVNAVSPAFIETPMTDAMMDERAQQDGGDRDDAVARFLHDERPGIEPRRRGTVGEVAAVIVFVVSERATFVNGSSYRVDGGSVGTI